VTLARSSSGRDATYGVSTDGHLNMPLGTWRCACESYSATQADTGSDRGRLLVRDGVCTISRAIEFVGGTYDLPPAPKSLIHFTFKARIGVPAHDRTFASVETRLSTTLRRAIISPTSLASVNARTLSANS
jgi:hypothetical protein